MSERWPKEQLRKLGYAYSIDDYKKRKPNERLVVSFDKKVQEQILLQRQKVNPAQTAFFEETVSTLDWALS